MGNMFMVASNGYLIPQITAGTAGIPFRLDGREIRIPLGKNYPRNKINNGSITEGRPGFEFGEKVIAPRGD